MTDVAAHDKIMALQLRRRRRFALGIGIVQRLQQVFRLANGRAEGERWVTIRFTRHATIAHMGVFCSRFVAQELVHVKDGVLQQLDRHHGEFSWNMDDNRTVTFGLTMFFEPDDFIKLLARAIEHAELGQ